MRTDRCIHADMSDPWLTGSLISYICYSKDIDRLTKTSIHKVLFELKQTIGIDEVAGEIVPYYWYNQGPYSEVLNDHINELIEYGFLEEEDTCQGYPLYVVPDPEDLLDENDQIFYDALDTILEYFDPFHLTSFIERVYRTRAPYPFIPIFKLDIFNQINSVFENIERNVLKGNSDIDKAVTQTVSQIPQYLYKAEAAILDEEPVLEKYNQLFGSYVTITADFIDKSEEWHHDPLGYLNKFTHIRKFTSDAWYTFVKGFRMTDKGHDSYYDFKSGSWANIFNEKTTDFAHQIDSMENGDLFQQPSVRFSRNLSPEKTHRILSSIIKGYLS